MEIKILVVEDDIDVSTLLVQFLVKSGYTAVAAKTAEEAQEILKNEPVTLVLTDIKLPGMDGIKFADAIKGKYDLDVIVMTGYSSEYCYEDAIKHGASDLLFKPVRLNELILRINRVMKERWLLRELNTTIEKLKRQTIEDPLTGLYNSRHFFDQLRKEIKRSDRYLHPVSLMFIDIDNFKRINDTCDHMTGDKILSLIAEKIVACLRFHDTAYRLGGDEFATILPETTCSSAKFVADRILTAFAHDTLMIKETEISKVTLSIGIAEYRSREGDQQFLHRADSMMYEAKRHGGNTVTISMNEKNFPCSRVVSAAIQKSI